MTDASQAPLVRQPYPGLRPFHRDESDIFFGREEQVDELLVRLHDRRFLGVVGTSGCGKSSLIKAGLLPALDAGFMGSVGSSWFIADMRPGDKPLSNLADALKKSGVLRAGSSDFNPSAADISRTLRRGPLGVIELLNRARLPEFTNLLILADQFEEIFRFRDRGDPNEALAFVNLLLTTASRQGVPAYVVLTMRSDFLGECTVFPGLPEALNESQFLCPRLTREQCREAIEGPAAVCQTEVEPKLVSRILNDIGTDPDQLPLMQHALMRLWSMAKESGKSGGETVLLTCDAYNRLGGLHHALSRHADEAFEELAAVGKERLVEQLFRSLSERAPDGQAIRREASVQEVADLAKVSPDEVIQVADRFRDPDRSFLTPPADRELKPDDILDVSHESLIRQWDRMRDWEQTEAESAARYRRLVDSARLKEEGAGDWLSGLELQNVQQWWDEEQPTEAWTKRYGGQWDECKSYLEESIKQARQAKMRKTVLIVSAFIVTLALAVYANWQRGVAVATLEKERLANIENTAAGIMNRFRGREDYPAAHEYIALAELADSDDPVKLAFLRQILDDETLARTLRSRLPYLVHAIVGLDRQMGDKVKTLLIQKGSTPHQNADINIACADLGVQLGIFEPKVVAMIVSNCVAAMEKTTDASDLSYFGRALASLGEKLPAEQATAGAQHIVAAMEKTTSGLALDSLGRALGSLGEKLSDDEVISILKSFVCVDAVREEILARLEKKAEQPFDGNLWKAVERAENESIDVKRVPRWPVRNQDQR